MPKYRVETKCFGFKGQLWERGQIVILGDHEKPPHHFVRLGEPKPEKPGLTAPPKVASAAEKVKFAESAEAAAVEAGKLAKKVQLKANKSKLAADKDLAKDLESKARAAKEQAIKARAAAKEAVEAEEAAKDAAAKAEADATAAAEAGSKEEPADETKTKTETDPNGDDPGA